MYRVLLKIISRIIYIFSSFNRFDDNRSDITIIDNSYNNSGFIELDDGNNNSENVIDEEFYRALLEEDTRRMMEDEKWNKEKEEEEMRNLKELYNYHRELEDGRGLYNSFNEYPDFIKRIY